LQLAESMSLGNKKTASIGGFFISTNQ